MIDSPAHSLAFGDLVWIEDGANPPDESGVTYRVKAQDATFGTAVPITTALMWLGRAGAPVAYDSTPNREPVFRVTVEGDTSDDLARGEMALQLQCEQPTTLTFTPPDGAGEPSVFDIVWSHLEPIFDRDGLTGVGMEETVLRSRTYLVRMQALPYAHPEDITVTAAQAATPTYTLVDNGGAVSGAGFAWSDHFGYTLSVASGRMRATRTGASVVRTWLTRTGTIAIPSSARYMAVDLAVSNAALTSLKSATTATDAPIGTPSAMQDLGGGLTRYFFTIAPASAPGTSTSGLQLRIEGTVPAPLSAHYVEIDQVQFSDSIPFIGTGRQHALSLIPGGSVTTHGSVQVAHETNALGKVVVYTHPSGTGYLPPLSPWWASGDARSTDTARLSGKKGLITTISLFRIPAPVVPQGRSELWAWLWNVNTATVRIFWAADSWVNSQKVGATEGGYTDVAFTANTWQLVSLGALAMPPSLIGPAGYVQVGIIKDAGSAEVPQMDEAYLFATDQGSLTVVDCGTGTPSAGGPSNRLWIDAPTPAEPMGTIWRGNATDRSDAFHAGSLAQPWGVHDFAPRGTNVFVATAGTLDAATSLEHYRRYNTFVTREN